jgi:AbiU2
MIGFAPLNPSNALADLRRAAYIFESPIYRHSPGRASMSNIPEQIFEFFEPLQDEIVWLHSRWILYEQLFGASEKRIDLLNESAGVFFRVVQDTFLGEMQIALSKLTDPARQGRFDNLSLEQVQDRVNVVGDCKLAATTRSLLDDLHPRCEAFRTWRNKTLAHSDLHTSLHAYRVDTQTYHISCLSG